MFGAPGELLLRRYQVPAPGSNTPTVPAVGAPGVGVGGEGGVKSLAPVLMPSVPSTFPTETGWASLWYCSGAWVAAARVPTSLASAKVYVPPCRRRAPATTNDPGFSAPPIPAKRSTVPAPAVMR